MPNDHPNNAADMPVEERDTDTAARAIQDGQGDEAAGGSATRGASPNAPIDTGVNVGDVNGSGEAKVLAAEGEAEAHPS